MQEIETAAFARGISAASLMDQAGAGIAAAISSFFPDPGTAILYLGKGNNAGDALVAARHLHANGWQIWARLSASTEAFKTLPSQHFEALGSHLIVKSAPITCHDLSPVPVIALAGLLGIGA